MRHKVTKRGEAMPGALEDYIGYVVSTPLTATMRAKLVAVSRELCLFETSPTANPRLREKGYDCVVGELFTLPSRDVLFMHFPPDENPKFPYDKAKTNKTRKRRTSSN